MSVRPRPVLVFIHYFGGSARSWSPVLEALGDDFESIVPDLPGFGGTPPPATVDLDAYIDHVTELVGGRRWIAIGHSMGGKIALGAAARSNTLGGMVLIAPSPPTPEPMSDEDRAAALAAFGDRSSAESRVREASNAALTPEVFQRAVDDSLRVDRRVWTWWLERGSRVDISSKCRSAARPALVLYGDADRILGSAVPNRVAADLPSARALAAPGGGHFLPLEQPHTTARAIRMFADLEAVRT